MKAIQFYESEFGGPSQPSWVSIQRAILTHVLRVETPGFNNRGFRNHLRRKFMASLDSIFKSSRV